MFPCLLPLVLYFFVGLTFSEGYGGFSGARAAEQGVNLRGITQELEVVRQSLSKIEALLNQHNETPSRTSDEKGLGIQRGFSFPVRKPSFEKQWQKGISTAAGTRKIKEIDLAEPSEEEDSYRHALSLLKHSKRREAEVQLVDFIQRFPQSKLIDNAYYFLGDLYLTEKKYKVASLNFLKSYQSNKKGNRAAFALVKSIKALKSIKEYGHACSILHKVLKEFPDDSAVKTQLEQEKEFLLLHCKD